MKRLNNNLMTAEGKLESTSVVDQRSLKKKVKKLLAQGFSRRAIGDKLGISHTQVQRISQELEGSSETKYFYWNDDEKLTRLEMKRRLRQIAKAEHWDKDSSALVKWEEQILSLTCGGDRVDAQKIAYLMATGPSRRGRKLSKDHGILLDESMGKEVGFFSEFYEQDANGERSPVDWGAYSSVFSAEAEPYFKPTNPPRVPIGTTPLECPRCGRKMLFQEPPCRILEDDGGWKLREPRIGYLSKRCKAGSCKVTTAPKPQEPTVESRRVRLIK